MAAEENPNLESFKTVTCEVYGGEEKADESSWTPKPYKEGKGRYLWTDAFGVCNFITLFCETGKAVYLDMADALIADVHGTLGFTRDGKKRLGKATAEHPTLGGLRIGKPDPEGTRDGDGQYLHYLTKWMFALNRMSLARGKAIYNEWAIELAESVHDSFVHKPEWASTPRLFWKISIDRTYPHVTSEGNLDPFDGFVTYRLLQQQAARPVLVRQLKEMEVMVEVGQRTMCMALSIHVQAKRLFSSSDPLDLGESLWLAHWFSEEEWAANIIHTSLASLEHLWKRGYFSRPASHRLAFREFGSTLGVQATPAAAKWKPRVSAIHDFWSKRLYSRDKDITPVMFCTSLIGGSMLRSYETKIRKIASVLK